MMKKEPLIAILVGVIMGTILATIVIRIQNPSVTDLTTETPTPSVNIKLDTTPTSELLLTVTSPLNGHVTKEKKQKFTGKLKSNAILLFQSEDTQVVKELAAGDFDEELELTEGINQVSVSAINNKESTSVKVNIYVESDTQKNE